MGALLTSVFSEQALSSWAWRLPFFFGLCIGPVGFYIRRNMQEPAEFVSSKPDRKIPLSEIFNRYPAELFVSFSLGAVSNIMVYVLSAYIPIYAVQSLHMPLNAPFVVLTITLTVRMMLVPYFGLLSDKIGRKKIMGTGLLLFTLAIYPAFIWLTARPTFLTLLCIELGFALLMAAIFGPLSTAIAEIFPAQIRSTALSLTYNLAASLLGGFTPFMLTWLVSVTGDKLMPAHYLMVFLLLGMASMPFYKEPRRMRENGREAAAGDDAEATANA
jgi:MFS family permease